MTNKTTVDGKTYFYCNNCKDAKEADSRGNCERCGRLIAPRRQGPDAGNDPALLAKYVEGFS